MTKYHKIRSVKEQSSDNDNRILLEWTGPDDIFRSYAVNQKTLKNFTTAEQIKLALDDWTQKSFGYVLTDVWFHLNDDGTWAIATGQEPLVWPEDEPVDNTP